MQNKANFRKAQMNVSSIITKDYESKPACRGRENKPNQSQFLFFTAENAEFAEQNCICISDCPIKKYNLYLPSLRSSRTRRLMRYKSKQSQFTPGTIPPARGWGLNKNCRNRKKVIEILLLKPLFRILLFFRYIVHDSC